MFKKLWDSWFKSKNSNVAQPQGFKQKKRSVFLNRYFGVFYFIVVWHALGYFSFGLIKEKANSEGKDLQEFLSLDSSRVRRININVGGESNDRPEPPK